MALDDGCVFCAIVALRSMIPQPHNTNGEFKFKTHKTIKCTSLGGFNSKTVLHKGFHHPKMHF